MRSYAVTLTLLALIAAAPANAAVICLANPAGRLAVDAGGTVLVDFDGAGIVKICSMSSATAVVAKEACVAWYSTLLTYRTMRTKARFYFEESHQGNAGVTSCAALGDWVSRNPYYMEPN